MSWPECARTFEHGGLLEEHADPAAERADFEAADVGAVEEHGARGGLPEAVERAEQRGLAAAAGPDDAHHHAARHVKVDAAQDLLATRRAAPQLAHPYLAGGASLRRRRPSCSAPGEQPAHVQQELPDLVVFVGQARPR